MKKIILIVICILNIICQSYAQKKPTIDRSRFEISTNTVSFSEKGGNKTVVVMADNDWHINRNPASWVTLTRTMGRIQLEVRENFSIKQRSTIFSITSMGKTINVKVNQAAAPFLKITPTSANFTADGGTKTFRINSTRSWRIGMNTISWGQISKNGNKLILRVTPNTTTASRYGYFTVKSGNKSVRVEILQSGIPAKFEISSESASFGANGGSETFTITSTDAWQIGEQTASWGHLTRNGNELTLNVDANVKTGTRTDYFTIISGDKQIRVNIKQFGSFLYVNGSSSNVTLNFDNYGYQKELIVVSNTTDFELYGKPYWCYVREKTSTGIKLRCYANNSSYYRYDWMWVQAGENKVRINISQEPNPKKYKRRINGGWINMALGCEGGYAVADGESWYTNVALGLRIGNYRDIFQLEFGATPGIISFYNAEPVFHLPLYSSLKLSSTSGKFYVKIGGTYNAIRDEYNEGKYSVRAGLGYARKHFEWDWFYVQLNAPTEHYGNVRFKDLFTDKSKMTLGMRVAWYITR